MTKYQVWLNSHVVTQVKAGEKIDVCDTENIWCKATVELVIKTPNRKDLLYLHYEGWNRKYDEFMYIDSFRIAPLGFYTERSDIPVYSMLNNQGRNGPVMYAVVLQSAQDRQEVLEYQGRLNQMNAQNEDGSDEEMEEAQNDGDIPESAQPISEQREQQRGQNRNLNHEEQEVRPAAQIENQSDIQSQISTVMPISQSAIIHSQQPLPVIQEISQRITVAEIFQNAQANAQSTTQQNVEPLGTSLIEDNDAPSV